jgi:hypothetical protein
VWVASRPGEWAAQGIEAEIPQADRREAEELKRIARFCVAKCAQNTNEE